MPKTIFLDWCCSTIGRPRDIQKWEYVPLGPFLGKNFASSISPWIVTLEALEPFRVAGPKQEPAVLPYLTYEGAKNYDIQLSVSITPKGGEEQVVCESNFKYMYWNMAQQLAHHTVNGCNFNVGDMPGLRHHFRKRTFCVRIHAGTVLGRYQAHSNEKTAARGYF